MNKKYVISDRLLLAVTVGIIAAMGANLFLFTINIFLPGNTINMPQLTLEVFLNVGSYTILQRILGFTWSLIVGSTYALVYIVFLDWTGWKHLWAKALIVVSWTWLFMSGYTMKLFSLAEATRNEPLSIAAFFIAHLFFATVLAFLVNRLGEPKVSGKRCLKKYKVKDNLEITSIIGEKEKNTNESIHFVKPKKIE